MAKTLAENAVYGPFLTFAFFPCVSIVEGEEAIKTLPARIVRDFPGTFVVTHRLPYACLYTANLVAASKYSVGQIFNTRCSCTLG